VHALDLEVLGVQIFGQHLAQLAIVVDEQRPPRGRRSVVTRVTVGGGWHHRHGGAAAMFHELGLTDAQRASMKSILEAAKPAMQELREKLQGNFRLLRQTSPDDKNYAAVVSRISQENGALTSKLISQRAAIYAKCYAVLAPVQKTHLAELQAKRANWMEEHKEHMKEHMQGHMDGHDPHEGAMGGSAPN
jgi:Spy/CpxP family protein refolding chaperone